MKKSFILAALAMGLCLSSCTEKIELVYSDKAVTDVELKTALEAQGVSFNEAGCILLDDAAEAITELDLSGKKISDFAGLEALPNLAKLNLSGNEYGPVFDLATLPAQVNSIDLTNNNISDFEGLVKEEEGDIVVLREIKSLLLPATMKENYDDMIPFYLMNKKDIESGAIEVKMADKEGKLNVYTTLREVSDANLVKYLEVDFPSILKDGKIDMAAGLALDQATKEISVLDVATGEMWGVPGYDIENFDGIQYVINNPTWHGAKIGITGMQDENGNPKSVLPTLTIPESVTGVFIDFVIGDLDFSKAKGLTQILMNFISGIKEIDLTGATLWGTRDAETELSNTFGSAFMVHGCPDVEKVILPEGKDLKCFYFTLEMFPKLKELDLSHLGMIHSDFSLCELADNCKITYPNLTLVKEGEWVRTAFACSTNVWELQSTKDFLDKYYTKAKDGDKIMKTSPQIAFDDFDWESELSK